MEVLPGGGRIRHVHIPFRAQLQEALESRARVLRPLPLEPMREQEDDARILPPLRPVRGEELIDDRLRDVGEVAELRFPEHEVFRRGCTEPVLEAQYRRLREGTVVDLERRARLRQLGERRVRVTTVHVMEHGLTMRERAALGILTGEPHVHSVDEERSER